MEIEGGTHKELPEEPQQEADAALDGEIRPEEQPGVTATEQEAPEPPGATEAEQQTSEQPTVTDTTLQAEAPSNELAGELDAAQRAPGEPDTAQETVSLPIEQASAPDTAQVPVSTRQRSRYTRWFQALAFVLLICVIGGVVLVVQARQGASGGHGRVAQLTPTPIPPLKVANWCVANGASVDPQAGQVSLRKVVALSSNDAWILGSTARGNNFNGNTGRNFPLLEHWNGTAWSVVQTADTSALFKQLLQKVGGGQVSYNVSLNDMAVLSDTNIWAVGEISVTKISKLNQSPVPGVHLMMQSSGQPLIEHWDGKTWQIVASPGVNSNTPDPLDSDQLTNISAISANDIWVVGTQAVQINLQQGNPPSSFPTSAPLAEHWDGTSWTKRPLPSSFQKEGLSFANIQALSSNDVWSFGSAAVFRFSFVNINQVKPTTPAIISAISKAISVTGSPSGWSAGSSTSHVVHWDGQNWNEMKLPNSLSKNTSLSDVAVISDNNIWAIGSNIDPKNKQKDGVAVIYHWDGSVWSSVAGAPGMDPKSSLVSISVIAPDNLWLLGSTSKNQPLMEHWDGKAWSVVSPTSPANGSVTDMALAGKHAWALVSKYSMQYISPFGASNSNTTGIPGTTLETNC